MSDKQVSRDPGCEPFAIVDANKKVVASGWVCGMTPRFETPKKKARRAFLARTEASPHQGGRKVSDPTPSEYLANTVRRQDRKTGRWMIECRKGLWAVDAPTLVQAEREARHYFWQYYADGEYAA